MTMYVSRSDKVIVCDCGYVGRLRNIKAQRCHHCENYLFICPQCKDGCHLPVSVIPYINKLRRFENELSQN